MDRSNRSCGWQSQSWPPARERGSNQSAPRCLHEIGGKPAARARDRRGVQDRLAASDIYVIVGHEAAKSRGSRLPRPASNFVPARAEQRGTGHAIQCARDQVKNYDTLLVLSGDAPLIRPESLSRMRDFHFQQLAAMTILTAKPADPFGYGRVIRRNADSPEVTAIVEQKALTPEQTKAPEINSGIYAFATAPLFEHIDSLATNNAHAELYLTDMASLLVSAGARVVAIQSADPTEVLGANTIAEMMDLDAAMRATKARELMASGVTIFRPETVTIDSAVIVGADTIIEPFVQLLGHTTIGEDCRIRSHSVIENSTIDNNVLIRNGSLLTEATIATGAVIGPYAHIRPGSQIGEDAHIGNFVETKKIKMGKGSKANHLTYLGDAEIGSGTNIGAGTITCNYDGVDKHMTTIGSNVFRRQRFDPRRARHSRRRLLHRSRLLHHRQCARDALAIGRGRQVTKTRLGQNQRSQSAKRKAESPLNTSSL